MKVCEFLFFFPSLVGYLLYTSYILGLHPFALINELHYLYNIYIYKSSVSVVVCVCLGLP
jgi:hypothetical protein